MGKSHPRDVHKALVSYPQTTAVHEACCTRGKPSDLLYISLQHTSALASRASRNVYQSAVAEYWSQSAAASTKVVMFARVALLARTYSWMWNHYCKKKSFKLLASSRIILLIQLQPQLTPRVQNSQPFGADSPPVTAPDHNLNHQMII